MEEKDVLKDIEKENAYFVLKCIQENLPEKEKNKIISFVLNILQKNYIQFVSEATYETSNVKFYKDGKLIKENKFKLIREE